MLDKRLLDGHLYKLPPTSEEEGEYGTHIVGGGARFLQAGSSLALECVVTHTRAPPTAVLWYHDNHVLDYDAPRGGISLQVRLVNSGGEVRAADQFTAVGVFSEGVRLGKLHLCPRQCSDRFCRCPRQ
ncbi:hypothetical protein Pmani_034813 [Petrolisthes manimaculis]|uniref:Ig-like domain-containing protein n=1 Tax=Petrolisthes manimaculis TaxID=1843537 RepID=A0AAE1NLR1_9EUCA|nr:hypothetical protein Pmani_034813 [Petrolisthes manimaculis]